MNEVNRTLFIPLYGKTCVSRQYDQWIDCDFPEVIDVRRKYYTETEHYHMMALDAADSKQVAALRAKYPDLHILMDVYTEFGAKASKYKNPVNDVGVTELYGVDDIQSILDGLGIRVVAECSFTPARLVNELKPLEREIFRLLFTGKIYRRIYRLFELAG